MSETQGGGPGQPPGWYRDAQGTMRWWDGNGWTEQVQENAPPAGGGPVPHYSGNPKADAKAAKAYAKASRPFYAKKRWWLVGGLLIIIIAVAASGGGGDDGDGDDRPPEERAADATKVNAAKILKDFEDNEAAADGKYKGKTLQITGVVEKVDTEIFDDDEYVIEISGGERFVVWTVNCDDQSSDEVSSLKKGDDITVVGDFEDGGDLGVELDNCAIL